MKDRDVHRSVRTQRFTRSAGDAPSLGKVARVHSAKPPKEALQRRRRGGGPRGKEASGEGRHHRNVIITWTAVLVLAVLGVLAVFFWSWLRPRMNRQPLEEEQAAVQRRNVSEFDSPTEEAALELVKQALALRDPAKVEQYFRTGSSGPAAVISFLSESKDRDGETTGFQWLSSMDANGLLIDGVLVSSSKDGVPRNRLALLTPDETGMWKIDFEAFARTVKPSWKKLLAPEGGQGTARVIVAKDSYYNGPFKDETLWESYGMASPDTDMILLGYCRKDSPQSRAMQRMLSNPKTEDSEAARKLTRATFELKRPEGAENRQFEIVRVLAEDWVLAKEPFDAAFE